MCVYWNNGDVGTGVSSMYRALGLKSLIFAFIPTNVMNCLYPKLLFQHLAFKHKRFLKCLWKTLQLGLWAVSSLFLVIVSCKYVIMYAISEYGGGKPWEKRAL